MPEYAPAHNMYDHTSEFQQKDISDNKVFAMLCYLSGLFGVLIALIAAQKSEYAMFHARQALKFIVVDTLMLLVVIVLFWTFIVPIIYGIAAVALWVIKIIAVFQIGSGKAVEPAIIRNIGFLR
ncbi:MAG: zinc ribbon domain-containing protein [Eubacteriales bacterium]